MADLTRKDLADLKRIVNRAIKDKSVREELLKGRIPSGKRKLSKASNDLLASLTEEELNALASIFAKLKAAGAEIEEILGIIF